MGRIIEGIWNCKSCGTSGIGASNKTCPNCGTVQEEYFFPEQIRYVDKPIADKVRDTGPDWYCEFCDRYNSSKETLCSGCGSLKGQSKKNYFDRKKELHKEDDEFDAFQRKIDNAYKSISKEEETPEEEKNNSLDMISVDTEDRNKILPIRTLSYREKYQKPNAKWTKIKDFLITASPFVAILGIVIFLIFAFTVKIPHEETVTGFSWERNVEVEDFVTVDEKGWSLPSEGRLHYTKEEIHHYDQVIDHYETVEVQKSREVIDHYEDVEIQKSRQVVDYYEEVVTGYKDLGNGYYEEITKKEPVYKTEYYTETKREPVYKTEYYTETKQEPVYKDVPVYKTRYYYEIDKWVHNRYEKTSGSDKSPYWAEPKILGNQRSNHKSEAYVVHMVDEDGETNSYSYSEAEWYTYELGDKLIFTTNLFGIINSDTVKK